jgi:hypothetical protein
LTSAGGDQDSASHTILSCVWGTGAENAAQSWGPKSSHWPGDSPLCPQSSPPAASAAATQPGSKKVGFNSNQGGTSDFQTWTPLCPMPQLSVLGFNPHLIFFSLHVTYIQKSMQLVWCQLGHFPQIHLCPQPARGLQAQQQFVWGVLGVKTQTQAPPESPVTSPAPPQGGHGADFRQLDVIFPALCFRVQLECLLPGSLHPAPVRASSCRPGDLLVVTLPLPLCSSPHGH